MILYGHGFVRFQKCHLFSNNGDIGSMRNPLLGFPWIGSPTNFRVRIILYGLINSKVTLIFTKYEKFIE